MVGPMPVREVDSAGNPATPIRGTPGALAHTLPPFLPNAHQFRTECMLDSKKTGAVLLFSGVFMGLVGITFTAMGWQHYYHSASFEWTLLLGPIFISVGGIFVLSSVCKFGILSLCSWGQWSEEVLVIPVMEQTSTQHSFIVSRNSQPINPTTAVPPHNFGGQEVSTASELPPRYDTLYCTENDNSTAGASSEPEDAGHRIVKTEEQDGGRSRDDASTCPPAYDDIYPSFNNIT